MGSTQITIRYNVDFAENGKMNEFDGIFEKIGRDAAGNFYLIQQNSASEETLTEIKPFYVEHITKHYQSETGEYQSYETGEIIETYHQFNFDGAKLPNIVKLYRPNLNSPSYSIRLEGEYETGRDPQTDGDLMVYASKRQDDYVEDKESTILYDGATQPPFILDKINNITINKLPNILLEDAQGVACGIEETTIMRGKYDLNQDGVADKIIIKNTNKKIFDCVTTYEYSSKKMVYIIHGEKK